jgi:BASS family bile acid:Na+ symporter
MAAIARDYYDRNAEGSLLMIGKMAVISLVICAANFFIGGLLSKRYKHESSQILGQKNTTFVVYLALEYASGAAALGTIFYVIYHNLWNSIQLFLHQKRSEE